MEGELEMRTLSEQEEQRMKDLEYAIGEAKRFINAGDMVLAMARRGEKSLSYQCREMAAMKRASLDLSMALPVLRKGIYS